MYCAVDDLAAIVPLVRLSQMVDDEGDGGPLTPWPTDAGRDEINAKQQRVWDAISRADETIDVYLRGRYPTPLAPVPTKVRELSADLTIATLIDRRNAEGEPNPGAVKRRDAAMQTLRDLQAGRAVLDVETPSGKAQPNEIRTNSRCRRFPASLLAKRP